MRFQEWQQPVGTHEQLGDTEEISPLAVGDAIYVCAMNANESKLAMSLDNSADRA